MNKYREPEFWKQSEWYRTNEPLQVCSGIRERHDTLLNSPLNDCDAKNVLKIYNRLAKQWM